MRQLDSIRWTVEPDGDGTVVVDIGTTAAERVTRTLADAGIYLSELTPLSRSLEDVFLELTEDPQ